MHFFMARDKKKRCFLWPEEKKFGHHCLRQSIVTFIYSLNSCYLVIYNIFFSQKGTEVFELFYPFKFKVTYFYTLKNINSIITTLLILYFMYII
jgi:hypothetical protein